MAGATRYLKFIGDYDNFDGWKENTKEISGHKGIFKYIKKEWEITKEEDAEDDPDLLKIYEGKYQGQVFPDKQSDRHTFWVGDAVQRECRWIMEGTHRQIWGFIYWKESLNEVTNS